MKLLFKCVRILRERWVPIIVFMHGGGVNSEYKAFRAFRFLGVKSGSRGRLKHLPDALFGLCRAFQVSIGAYLVRHGSTLLRSHWLLSQLHQLFLGALVVAQVTFVAHEHDWNVRTKVFHLRIPFFWYVLQTVGRVDREAH